MRTHDQRPHSVFPRPPAPADLVHDPSAATNHEIIKALIVAREDDELAVSS